MSVRFDPMYNEPAPRKHWGIKCFDCKALLASKAVAVRHKGHSVHYINERGEVED